MNSVHQTSVVAQSISDNLNSILLNKADETKVGEEEKIKIWNHVKN